MKYTNFLFSIGTALAAVTPAFAQEAQPSEDVTFGEIIVTANKRVENLNRSGVTAAVLSEKVLQDRQIVTLSDISSAVPGLSFSQGQYGPPILALRGVGFQETSLGVYPATSTYTDEVPLPFAIMALHAGFDLQRIEVLKGPQGVLYGENSTGGGINFIANKPSNTFGAGARLTYARFNRVDVEAHVTGPLAEGLTARVAGQYVRSDGWQKSMTRPGDKNGSSKFFIGRAILNYEPSDTTSFALSVNGWQDKSDPLAFQLVAVTPKSPALAPGLAALQFALPLTDDNARSADWSPNFDPSGNRKFFQASLRGDFDLSDSTTLTALGAYSRYTQHNMLDGDGSAAATADLQQQDGKLVSKYVEARLSNTSIDNLRVVVGANYQEDLTNEDQIVLLSDNTSSRPATFYVHRAGTELTQNIKAYAVFGNTEYEMAEGLTLKVGARYTNTKIAADVCGYDPGNEPGFPFDPAGNGANLADFFNFLGSLSGRTFTPAGANFGCYILDGPPGAGVPGRFMATLKEDNISWRGGLDYQITSDTLVYGSVSRGYKAGSYPLFPGFSFDQYTPVTQESVTAYEIGLKTNLAPAVHLNTAAFYYDYRDKQIRGRVLLPVFGPLDALQNVPKSRIWGIEGDLTARLTDSVTLFASGTYLNSKIKDFSGPDVFDVFGRADSNFNGEPLPSTPKFSYSIGLDYRQPISSGTIVAGAVVNGKSSQNAILGARNVTLLPAVVATGLYKTIRPDYFVIDGYATVDLRIGYESENNRWNVMLWGKNVGNKFYYNNVFASSEGAARVAEMPATYGITLGANF